MEQLPLQGKTVIVTRPQQQAGEFADLLRARGAEIEFFPAIEIAPPESWDAVDASIEQNRAYDAVIFTSSNAVRSYFDRARERGTGPEHFMRKTIYAIGSKTAEAAAFYGMHSVRFPGVTNARELASALIASGAQHRRYLVPKGRRAGSEIAEALAANHAAVDEVIVYETVMPQAAEHDVARIREALAPGKENVVTFFSPSSVENFFFLLKDLPPADAVIAAIGETTAGALRSMRVNVDVVPAHPRIGEFAEAIERYLASRCSA